MEPPVEPTPAVPPASTPPVTPIEGETTPPAGIQRTAPPEPKWFDKISEEFRTGAEGYESLDEYAKANQHHRSLASKKGLVVPDATATLEVIADYRKAIGVPDNAADYEMNIPKEFAGRLQESEIEGIKSALYNADLNQGQFEKVVGEMLKARVVDATAADTSANEIAAANELAIAKMWGDQTDVNMKLAQNVADALDFSDTLVEAGQSNNPKILAKLLEMSSQFDEASLEVPRMTVKSYKEEYNELFAKVKKSVRGSTEHAALNKDLMALVARKVGK